MADAAPMPVLLEYQRRYLADAHKWKAACWARQTGKTFTTTLEAVIDVLEAEAAGRVSPWTIMSVSRDRALDAMENGVKRHLRAFRAAFEALDEPLEADEPAHVVRLPGGSYIRAVAARPETARGMSDNLILDEFAHHRDNRAIWQAVLPIVSRPDRRVRVISTPAGVGDMFHQIMTDPAMPFSGHRYTVTIQDAVAAGLDRDIEELRWALVDPVAWAQEFECAFIEGASAWLPYDLIIACEDERAGLPHLYQGGPAYVGMDIAARGDLTVIAVAEDMGGVLVLRELVEMRGESFAGQLFALDRVMRQYRVVRAALDQTGMGEMVVEEARRRHGQLRVEGVLFTPPRRLDLATAPAPADRGPAPAAAAESGAARRSAQRQARDGADRGPAAGGRARGGGPRRPVLGAGTRLRGGGRPVSGPWRLAQRGHERDRVAGRHLRDGGRMGQRQAGVVRWRRRI
ncbi:MAG: hypothetical protein KatS3mg119_1898 [Rhodothalassiaceae bacterium]|nr:MAG: hypothetical protein KatS3mg119_1898 [Rhodothalassiaceae bacterium]